MNMLETMDQLQHCEGCDFNLSFEGACDCGLDEVRTAVRELVDAAGTFWSEVYIEYSSDIPRHERLGRALAPFLDAQDDAG